MLWFKSSVGISLCSSATAEVSMPASVSPAESSEPLLWFRKISDDTLTSLSDPEPKSCTVNGGNTVFYSVLNSGGCSFISCFYCTKFITTLFIPET